MTRHEWKEKEDGTVTWFRASIHAGRWTMERLVEGEEDWTKLDPPPLPELRTLRDVLFRKYQRKRVPYGHVEQIDRMIADAEDDG